MAAKLSTNTKLMMGFVSVLALGVILSKSGGHGEVVEGFQDLVNRTFKIDGANIFIIFGKTGNDVNFWGTNLERVGTIFTNNAINQVYKSPINDTHYMFHKTSDTTINVHLASSQDALKTSAVWKTATAQDAASLIANNSINSQNITTQNGECVDVEPTEQGWISCEQAKGQQWACDLMKPNGWCRKTCNECSSNSSAGGNGNGNGSNNGNGNSPEDVDCKVSEWSDCSATCGGGKQTRTIITQASGNGTACPTELEQECNTQPCCTNHCPVGEFLCTQTGKDVCKDGKLSEFTKCETACSTGHTLQGDGTGLPRKCAEHCNKDEWVVAAEGRHCAADPSDSTKQVASAEAECKPMSEPCPTGKVCFPGMNDKDEDLMFILWIVLGVLGGLLVIALLVKLLKNPDRRNMLFHPQQYWRQRRDPVDMRTYNPNRLGF